jgi:hypothetical protein
MMREQEIEDELELDKKWSDPCLSKRYLNVISRRLFYHYF